MRNTKILVGFHRMQEAKVYKRFKYKGFTFAVTNKYNNGFIENQYVVTEVTSGALVPVVNSENIHYSVKSAEEAALKYLSKKSEEEIQKVIQLAKKSYEQNRVKPIGKVKIMTNYKNLIETNYFAEFKYRGEVFVVTEQLKDDKFIGKLCITHKETGARVDSDSILAGYDFPLPGVIKDAKDFMGSLPKDKFEQSMERARFKRRLEIYEKRFRELFNIPMNMFYNGFLIAFGNYSIDIIRLDDYMKRHRGYKEEKHGSLKDFIKLQYGEEASKLIEEVLDNG